MMRVDDLTKANISKKNRRYNLEWIDALQMENMLLMLELSAKSALMRTESRGTHYRLDYPNTDNDNWLKNIFVRQFDGEISLCAKPIVATSIVPPKGVQPYLKTPLKTHLWGR